MKKIQPPIPIQVDDFANFARLTMGLTEDPQLLWLLQKNQKKYLALFTSYMYWEGDIPFLAYIELKREFLPFLAYRSDSLQGEQYFFTEDIEDTKFKYASIIELRKSPGLFLKSLEGKYSVPKPPILVEVENLNSLVRVLLAIYLREGTVFPLWNFTSEHNNILGTCIPFEHYFNAEAVPIYIYHTLTESPLGSFLKYRTTKSKGEEVTFSDNTREAKYFYSKIIRVISMPLFPSL